MKTFCILMTCCGLFGLLVTLAYQADKAEVIAQYGPRTTASGRVVTVKLVEDGFMVKKYTIFTDIIDETGAHFKTDVKEAEDATEANNLFMQWVMWVKEGWYETNLKVCQDC